MKIGKFEIIERKSLGKKSIEETYNNAPIVVVTASYLSFTSSALRILRTKVGNDIIYATNEGNVYVAAQSGTINSVGFRLQASKGKNNNPRPLTVMPMNLKQILSKGYYVLSTLVNDDGLDWYLLKKL